MRVRLCHSTSKLLGYRGGFEMARPPKRFHEFIGQRRVISHLSRLTDGSKARGKPAPSFLLVAGSGQGKRALAEAPAREYDDENAEGSLPTFHHLVAGNEIEWHRMSCRQSWQSWRIACAIPF